MSPEPFSAFVERALYGPDGFYRHGGGAGRRRDFLTSPEVGPLFGAVLARALDGWWREAGSPHRFHVVDAGAGPGTLGRSVVAAEPACAAALRWTDIEIGSALPERADVIVANELLDNLPFDVVEHTAEGWREVLVDAGGEVLAPTDRAFPGVAVGRRVPVLTRAARWVGDALDRAPLVVAFDYGAATTAELAERRWLRTYAAHERGFDPYADVGRRDITTEIAIDQLPAPASVERQHQFLRQHGIVELVEEGRRAWVGAVGSPDLVALRMASRVSEAEALLDTAGLGAFWVMVWRPS